MKLLECIQQLASGALSFSEHRIIAFCSAEYPYLFASMLRHYFKQQCSFQSIESLDAFEDSAPLLAAQTSFVKKSTLYFYNAFSQTESKKVSFLQRLSHYQGEHTVIIFSKESVAGASLHVELDATVALSTFQGLLSLIGIEQTDRVRTAQKIIFSRIQSLSLEQACLLAHYMKIAGNWVDEFSKEWLELIVRPDMSLFALSQYFFSKNALKFYHHWSALTKVYPDLFWISYWSEQLFRASEYVTLQEYKHYAQAKAIGYRLPFSFLNQDWKKYTYNELVSAHDFIYTIDYGMKNGAENTSLDLFYHSFFLGSFKK